MKVGEVSQLYKEIADRLLAEFEAVTWQEGAMLPSEAQLQLSFGVSRTTVRRALATLESRGYIQRHQGKGSFYHDRKMAGVVSGRVGFYGTAKTTGHLPFSKIHAFEVRPPNMSELTVFGPGARQGVVELRRLRLLDGRPAMFQTSVIAIAGIAKLTRSDFENVSLYSMLRRRFGVIVTDVSTKLEALNAPENIAKLMAIEPGTAIFNSHRMVKDQSGKYIELSNNFVRSDIIYFFLAGSPDELNG